MNELEKTLKNYESKLGINQEKSKPKIRSCIMVVDDDEGFLRSLIDTLSEKYEVIACSSGTEALTKVKEGLSAIVLDIKMPNMNGLQVLEKMADRNIKTPVILNTGFSGEYLEQDVRSKYCPFGYVTKDNPSLLLLNLATAVKCFSNSSFKAEHTLSASSENSKISYSTEQPQKCIKPDPPFQLDWIEPRLIDSAGHSFFMSTKLHNVLRVMLCTEPGTRGVIRGAISDKAVASLYSGKDINDPEEATKISMNFRANLRKTFDAYGVSDRKALIRRSKTYGGYVLGKNWHPKKPLLNQSEVNLSFREIHSIDIESESNDCYGSD